MKNLILVSLLLSSNSAYGLFYKVVNTFNSKDKYECVATQGTLDQEADKLLGFSCEPTPVKPGVIFFACPAFGMMVVIMVTKSDCLIVSNGWKKEQKNKK